ncbi:MAG: hypothetical protein AAFV86_12095 [Pseudomonadota bacterium]
MTLPKPRSLVRTALALAALQLAGCAAVPMEAASVAIDKATVWRNIDAARAGDVEAQYRVGQALCCSGDVPEGSAYSTEEALHWLCVAASQGSADAMLKLGKIFEGDQVDGVRLVRRAMTAVTETPENPAAAHYWYARAAEAGEEDAAETARALYRDMTPAERAAALAYADAPEPPCRWDDLRAEAQPVPSGAPLPSPSPSSAVPG